MSETVVVGFGSSLLAIPFLYFCFPFSVEWHWKFPWCWEKQRTNRPKANFHRDASSNGHERSFPGSRKSKIRDV